MIKIVSHRGEHHDTPENAFAAANLALQQGADAIDTDRPDLFASARRDAHGAVA